MKKIGAIICLSLVSLTCFCNAIGPFGTTTGPVQFDAVIRLDPEMASTHMLLFARYWVSSEYYEFSVVWCEPTGPGLRFPVFPVSLEAGSDTNTFEMRHDMFGVYNTNYAKPVGAAGDFHYMYGDYPIVNLRFSDSESFAERIYVDDFSRLDRLQSTTDSPQTFRVPGHERIVQDIEARSKESLLTSLVLFDSDHRTLQNIQYDYEGSGANARLARETVMLPERPFELSLPGEGVTVKTRSGPEHYRNFSGLFQRGGRKCSIEYGTITLGGAQVTLPLTLAVKDYSNGKTLRSVRFSNFRLTNMDRAAARAAAAEFGGLTADLRKEDELSRKYASGANAVAAVDLAGIKDLRDRLEATEDNDSLGRRLRRLGVLRRLNDLLADESEIQRLFLSYLSLLQQKGLHDMVLWGGAEAIDAEAAAGRCALAERLMVQWLDLAMQDPDIAAALRFGRLGLENSRNWELIRLFERFETTENSLTIPSRFEMQGLKCLAYAKLLEASLSPKSQRDSSNPNITWSECLSDEGRLRQIRDESLAKAMNWYQMGTGFTEAQQSLHEKLSKCAPIRK